MKSKFDLLKTVLLPLFCLFGIMPVVKAQTVDLSKSVMNITTSSAGTVAAQNDILEYTMVIRNISAANITSARLYDNIPAGVSYETSSTTLNGVLVADVSGKMPFANTGGAIQSPLYGTGILAPNVAATVTFRVKVTANGGNITNYATLTGTYNSASFSLNTNTVFTNLTPDATCNVVFQSTAQLATMCPSGCSSTGYYRRLRTMSIITGFAGTVMYDGASGNCTNAMTGAALPAGTVLNYASALAYDKNTNRVYFINNYDNNPPEDLCYIDLATTPISAKRYVGYPLETNSAPGYNINRMCFASDGNGYAVTSNGRDLIRFSVHPVTNLPIVARLGALLNDPNNNGNDILAETGGDIFGDGSGALYLIANASKLYKINPNTRVSTYLGTVTPAPPSNSNSIAIDAAGNVYIGGAYNRVYRIDLSTMAATLIGSNMSTIFTNGDYTSCAFPVLAPTLVANKTVRNINGSTNIVGGDTVEYTIEVTNNGNINAANVKLYDSIPSSTNYIPGSTRLNAAVVADVSGVMPFSVVGGRYINSPGQSAGILRPGTANKAIVTFRAKVTPLHLICNQSRVTLIDGDGNTIFINSDNPNESGGQNSTCFFSDGVLPLNTLQFRGSLKNEYSVLNWTGTSEENIAYYEMQYSDNGTNFTPIGMVEPRSNGQLNNGYQYTDMTNTISGKRLYRLKVVQKGGSSTYTGIIILSVNAKDVKVTPNPFDKELTLQFQLKTSETLRIRLVDVTGREVFGTSEKFQTGNHSISLNMPRNLTSGMYVLEMLSGNTRLYTKKLLKN